MKIQAIIAIGTLAVLTVEPALWHFLEVELVQEFTLVALLAEAAQPMLAHDGLVAATIVVVVPELARVALAAPTSEKELANLAIFTREKVQSKLGLYETLKVKHVRLVQVWGEDRCEGFEGHGGMSRN
ncbi:hypothetical protein BC937DRAFT_90758 [Endogone sp. FLAS-F59071]|nr:hypothetical protein BC937DRAFT_90758 [Endogone sp. FLAS-F59071]|eukprot:RUS16819.1 hypothetical protein BC937DRAFT_90758 [Endogone sp. FLAS-F59071]